MEWLEHIPPGLQGLAAIVFTVAVALFAAWSSRKGARESAPKVQEFAVAGQLADMRPVMQLIEDAGLLIQQQVRTNLHLEAAAVALTRVATAYEKQIEAAQEERDIEAEVQRRLDHQLRERRRRASRPRKPAATK